MKLLVAFLLLVSRPVWAEEIVLGLSQDAVSITATYDGSDILIFGAVKREVSIPTVHNLDVIVTISGPAQDITIRRKSQVGPIWINQDAQTIQGVPSFYALASNRPLEQVLTTENDANYHISAQAALLNNSDLPADFAEALLRLRSDNGMLVENSSAVSLSEETLFRAQISLPADLIEGDYQARIFLLRNSQVIDTTSTEIPVRKVGIERILYRMAQDQPALYGLLALLIASLAGWGASKAFALMRR